MDQRQQLWPREPSTVTSLEFWRRSCFTYFWECRWRGTCNDRTLVLSLSHHLETVGRNTSPVKLLSEWGQKPSSSSLPCTKPNLPSLSPGLCQSGQVSEVLKETSVTYSYRAVFLHIQSVSQTKPDLHRFPPLSIFPRCTFPLKSFPPTQLLHEEILPMCWGRDPMLPSLWKLPLSIARINFLSSGPFRVFFVPLCEHTSRAASLQLIWISVWPPLCTSELPTTVF